jgi:hypothetical protein
VARAPLELASDGRASEKRGCAPSSKVAPDGSLTLRLNLDLDTHSSLHYERTYTATSYWEFDENGLMKRRDASIDHYNIDQSGRRYRQERPGEEEA